MEYKAKILEHVEARRDFAVDFLRQMINFDSSTINHGFGGREQAIQEWLAEHLEGWGFVSHLFEPDNAKMDDYPDFSRGHDYANRPNLVATLKGVGGGRSLILNGHVDTMPPGDQKKWTYDPWEGQIEGGDMYGLGVCDMKAGVAAMILAVRFLQETGLELKGDVLVQSVVDEEGGGNGTLACVVEGYKADAAIVTEPTRLHVQPATRGVLLLQVDVEGQATHACLKWGGINAIEKGIKIVQGMIELERLWFRPPSPSARFRVAWLVPRCRASACSSLTSSTCQLRLATMVRR
jgi:acetylornithine deacetylase